jgi:hypothetical protein
VARVPHVGTRWRRVIPAWIASSTVHVVLLLLFVHVTIAANVDTPAVGIVPIAAVEPDTPPDKFDEITVGINPEIPPGDPFAPLGEADVKGLVDPLGDFGVPPPPAQPTPAPAQLEGGRVADPSSFRLGGEAFALPGGPGGGVPGPIAARVTASAKQRAIERGGGSAKSEAAVAAGLEWLALHQAADGRWSLHEFHRHARTAPLPAGRVVGDNCTGQAVRQNDIAATAFGLLPFLAAGLTHKSGKTGSKDYGKTVGAGLNFLIVKQGKDGYFGGDMYSHGLATIALCEAYGLSSDLLLKKSAQAALNYIVDAQDPAGGSWRYVRRTPGDLSVTGWQLMALKSGQMAGLAVPIDCMRKLERFLDSCETAAKGGYSYLPGVAETVTMTSVGLLCRQYLGVNPRNPGLRAGVERLKKVPPGVSGNLYYEYYATQVMHHMGGENWNFWNLGPDGSGKGGIRDTLIAKQDQGTDSKRPGQLGSWSSTGTGFEKEGGRIMATSLSLLTLEVYYRHLPLYRRDLGMMKDK